MKGYYLLPMPPMSKSSENRISKRGMYKSREYQAWANATMFWLKSLRIPFMTGRLRLHYIYVVPDLRRRDFDNAISGLLDCASGIVYKDDSQVWSGTWEKVLDREQKCCQLWFRFEEI
jgi:Holliday junction resolvase RusA-like endonuclease